MAQIVAHLCGAGAGMVLHLITSPLLGLVSDPDDKQPLRNTVHELFRSSDEIPTSTTTSTLLSTITIREPAVTDTITARGPAVTNPITIRRAAVTSTLTETVTNFDTQYITIQAPATRVIQEYFGEVFAKPRDFIPSDVLSSDFYEAGFWILLASLVCLIACCIWRCKRPARVAPPPKSVPAPKDASDRDAESQRLRFRESGAIISVNEEQRSIKGFPSNAPPQLNLSQISLSDIVLAIVCGSSDLSHAKIGKATFDRLMAEWILTRDAVKLFPDHYQSRLPMHVRSMQEYVAKVEGDWNKDEETRAEALKSVLHEGDSDDKVIINNSSLVRFASAINTARVLAVDACKEFYTVPVVTPLSRQNVPKHKVAQMASDADQDALPTLIGHLPKSTKTPSRRFRPRRSSTIDSDDLPDTWPDQSSPQPSKEHESYTAEAVAQEDSTKTTSPNAEVDGQPEARDEGFQDEVDEAPKPSAPNHARLLAESCSDEESEIPTPRDPESTSILEDVDDIPPSCEPAKESTRARSPPRDGGTDGGPQTPSAADLNPESAAPQAPEPGAKATPEDTESEKNADGSDRAPPAASKTTATKPDFSASAWYRSLFDQTFPRGWKSLFASSEGELCGLHALIRSVEAQLPNYTPPSLHELQQLAANLNSGELSYFSIGSLGIIVHAWGQPRDLNLHVGVCDRKKVPWGCDSSGPHGSIFEQEDAKVVWICSDDEGINSGLGADYEKQFGSPLLSHYSGVGHKDESGKAPEAKHQEGLLEQSLPEGSSAQPESEQLEATIPGNTDTPSDVNSSTASASKRHKKVAFSIPVEDSRIPRKSPPPSELSHSPNTSVGVPARNVALDIRTESSPTTWPATRYHTSKKRPNERSPGVNPPPALTTTSDSSISIPPVPLANDGHPAGVTSAQEAFVPVLAEVLAPKRAVSNGIAELQPESEHQTSVAVDDGSHEQQDPSYVQPQVFSNDNSTSTAIYFQPQHATQAVDVEELEREAQKYVRETEDALDIWSHHEKNACDHVRATLTSAVSEMAKITVPTEDEVRRVLSDLVSEMSILEQRVAQAVIGQQNGPSLRMTEPAILPVAPVEDMDYEAQISPASGLNTSESEYNNTTTVHVGKTMATAPSTETMDCNDDEFVAANEVPGPDSIHDGSRVIMSPNPTENLQQHDEVQTNPHQYTQIQSGIDHPAMVNFHALKRKMQGMIDNPTFLRDTDDLKHQVEYFDDILSKFQQYSFQQLDFELHEWEGKSRGYIRELEGDFVNNNGPQEDLETRLSSVVQEAGPRHNAELARAQADPLSIPEVFLSKFEAVTAILNSSQYRQQKKFWDDAEKYKRDLEPEYYNNLAARHLDRLVDRVNHGEQFTRERLDSLFNRQVGGFLEHGGEVLCWYSDHRAASMKALIRTLPDRIVKRQKKGQLKGIEHRLEMGVIDTLSRLSDEFDSLESDLRSIVSHDDNDNNPTIDRNASNDDKVSTRGPTVMKDVNIGSVPETDQGYLDSYAGLRKTCTALQFELLEYQKIGHRLKCESKITQSINEYQALETKYPANKLESAYDDGVMGETFDWAIKVREQIQKLGILKETWLANTSRTANAEASNARKQRLAAAKQDRAQSHKAPLGLSSVDDLCKIVRQHQATKSSTVADLNDYIEAEPKKRLEAHHYKLEELIGTIEQRHGEGQPMSPQDIHADLDKWDEAFEAMRLRFMNNYLLKRKPQIIKKLERKAPDAKETMKRLLNDFNELAVSLRTFESMDRLEVELGKLEQDVEYFEDEVASP